MKILFAGGGTAGHINPALAVAETLEEKYPDVKIAFIGREGGNENKLISDADFTFFTINIEGLKRSICRENIKRIKNAFSAKAKALEIITDFKPDIVFGTGGYVSWPVLGAAKKAGIKTVLHESNSSLGLASKLLAGSVDILLLGSSANIHKYKNAVFTGNPLRKNFKPVSQEKAKAKMGIPKEKLLILSVGGSIGAKRLNDVCLSLMENYSRTNDKIFHLHSTGARYFDELKETKPHLCRENRGCKAIPFVNDMATALSAADLVISRCGAMTLSEIAYCGCASILIPSPNVTGNHQLKNALHFKEHGAAVIIEEKNLCKENLQKICDRILNDSDFRHELMKNTKALATPESNEKIALLLKKQMLTK